MQALETRIEDVDELYNANEEQARLLLIFDDRFLGMLNAVHEAVKASLSLENFVLDDSATRRMLQQAAAQVVRIDETTRQAIAERLQEGQMRGLSNWEIANGTKDFPGIEGLYRETWKGRADTIARTELAEAQRLSAIDRYQQTGLVQQVQAIDGDYDEPCMLRNGRVYPLAQAPRLQHPNCTLVLVPILAGS